MKLFRKLSIKLQLLLAIIGGLLTAFLFYYVRGNIRLKKQMEYELSKVRKETEIAALQEEGIQKEAQIAALQRKEAEILEKIRFIEEKEILGEEVSIDELEDFFARRGF